MLLSSTRNKCITHHRRPRWYLYSLPLLSLLTTTPVRSFAFAASPSPTSSSSTSPINLKSNSPLVHRRPAFQKAALSSSFSTAIMSSSSPAPSTSTTDIEDAYIWLEDVEAKECLDFARDSNAKCLSALGDPKEGPSYQRILNVLESKDRIPHVSNMGYDTAGNRLLFNFWKDEEHPKGIWRSTTLDEYNNNNKAEATAWTTILDVDALAKTDDISWVWKGSTALPRARDPMSDNGRIVTRVLLSLSRGGSDAIHLKEFDLTTNDFVKASDGNDDDSDHPFILPEAKTRASYKSRNVLLVGSDFGPDTLTDSGYPRTVREWVRGTDIHDAPVVFQGETTDVAVSGYVADERIWGGGLWQIHSRSITFYTSKYYMAKLTEEHLLAPDERANTGKDLPAPEFVEMDIPEDADMDLLGNLLLLSLRSDWTLNGTTYKSGSVIYCSIDSFLKHGKEAEATAFQILFQPTDRTAYEYFTCTKNYLVLSTMDNVKSKLQFYKLENAGTSLTLVGADPEAKIRSCSVRPMDSNDSDEFWFTTSDYLTPSTLCLADAANVSPQMNEEAYVTQTVKSLPPQFDAAGLTVEQRMATSKDGTQIPYFIIYKTDMELNGKSPTLLYGYGGFEISLGPHYAATSGLAWLERGGVYVEANIRGGGEFGPAWHQAALKANRNKAYEDFIAVGEHLIETGICKPKTLAARGGSNGTFLID
jgi:prolyl oligopeptidase